MKQHSSSFIVSVNARFCHRHGIIQGLSWHMDISDWSRIACMYSWKVLKDFWDLCMYLQTGSRSVIVRWPV